MKDLTPELTPAQEAFVDLVRNAMMTGYLHLTSKTPEVVRRSNASRGTQESAADVLSDVLGDEPRSFIKHRPFEVSETLEKLEKLSCGCSETWTCYDHRSLEEARDE